MGPSSSRRPEWRLQRHGEAAELQLIGDWIARDFGVRSSAGVGRILEQVDRATLRVEASELGRWDSALIAFLKLLRDSVAANWTQPVQLDTSGLPDAARRLLALASAGSNGAPDTKVSPPYFTDASG